MKKLQAQLSASFYKGTPFKFFLGSCCTEIYCVLMGHVPRT